MNTLVQAGLNNALSASLLAVLVACLARLLTRHPAVLHCLWFLVLLKLVSPPLYEVPIPWMKPFQAATETDRSRLVLSVDLTEVAALVSPSESIAIETEDSMPAWLASWLPRTRLRAVGWTWLGGIIVTLLVSAWRIRQFHRLLSEAKPASERIQERVDDLAADLGIGRPPGLWWIPGKLSPMLWALGRSPRLIIPIELWKGLDERQRTTLLVHELAHLRRGDHHLRVFELLVTALYWWHPVLWWARRALRDVEEQCCDAWVVWAFPDAARSYAETLLETLDFLDQSDRAQPLLASGFGKVHHLRKRLTMIMTGNTPRTLSFGGALGSLSLAILMLPFNASWGQKPDEPIEVEVVAKSVDEPVISVSEAVTIASPVSVVVESGVTESGSTLSSAASLTTSTISSDDAKPKVHLELKTGGSAYVIEADSMKEAISKLSEQVKVLSKKESPSRQDKLTAEALEQAIKSLEKSAKAIDEKSASADKAKAIKDLRKIVIRKLDKGGKIITEDVVGKTGDVNANADKSKFGTRYTVVRSLDAKTGEIIANDLVRETQNAKAVIDKQAAQNQAVVRKIQALISHQAEQQTRIQHQIEKLRAELEQKTKEVATAKKRLAELQQLGSTGNLVKPNTVTITGGEPVKPRIELQIRTDGGKLKAKGAAVSVKAQNAEQKEKRLEELERSLRKLLEDVASLKKQGN